MQVMAGSHFLGQYLPGQRSTFTLTEPVCCPFASIVTYLWNDRVISFFQIPQGTITAPEHETTQLVIVIFIMLIVNC